MIPDAPISTIATAGRSNQRDVMSPVDSQSVAPRADERSTEHNGVFVGDHHYPRLVRQSRSYCCLARVATSGTAPAVSVV